ncbi:hypothetical protein Hdeb2414_s0079g00778791 [Helianthus debilis subsp. tardiflorus]
MAAAEPEERERLSRRERKEEMRERQRHSRSGAAAHGGGSGGDGGFRFQVRVKQCSGQPPVKDGQRWSKVRLGQFWFSFGSVNRSQQQICAVAGFEERVDSVKPSQLS